MNAMWSAVALLVATCAFGADVKQVRVCADPENFPFSTQKQEGSANKIERNRTGITKIPPDCRVPLLDRKADAK